MIHVLLTYKNWGEYMLSLNFVSGVFNFNFVIFTKWNTTIKELFNTTLHGSRETGPWPQELSRLTRIESLRLKTVNAASCGLESHTLLAWGPCAKMLRHSNVKRRCRPISPYWNHLYAIQMKSIKLCNVIFILFQFQAHVHQIQSIRILFSNDWKYFVLIR